MAWEFGFVHRARATKPADWLPPAPWEGPPLPKRLLHRPPKISEIPKEILALVPEDLRRHHLEHIYVPLLTVVFSRKLKEYKSGDITLQEFVTWFKKETRD